MNLLVKPGKYYDNLPYETFYGEKILPLFGIHSKVSWSDHIQTGPDNFIHIFTHSESTYMLAFDDYPSGFSMSGTESGREMRLTNGSHELYVESQDKYYENITGHFKLFEIVDEAAFNEWVAFVKEQYYRWQKDTVKTIPIARDILQIVENAYENKDRSVLRAMKNMIDMYTMLNAESGEVPFDQLNYYIELLQDALYDFEFHTPKELNEERDEIYKKLAAQPQQKILAQKYLANSLGRMVTLVSANYTYFDGETTEGTNISVVFDKQKRSYPIEHFLQLELEEYFKDNPYIAEDSIEYNMPDTLGKYRLVAGGVQIQKVFPRELEWINF